MIDSSKKQPQGFPEILAAGDFEPLKEKECLEGSNQKSLKEGQSVSGRRAELPDLSSLHLSLHVSALCYPVPSTSQVPAALLKLH